MSIDDPQHVEATGFRTFPSRGPVPRLQMPALQQTIQFIRDPIPLIKRGLAECGDIFALNILGFGTWIFVCSPEGVEQMVRLSNDVLTGGEVNHRFFSSFFPRDALFFLDGPQHLERRRYILSCLKEDTQHLTTTVERLMRQRIDTWPVGKPFAIVPELQEVSFQIIMEAIFGFQVLDQGPTIVDMLRRIALEVYFSPLLSVPLLHVDLGRFSPWGRLKLLHAEMCSILDAEIERRRKVDDLDKRPDMLSQLIVRQKECAHVVTNQALRNELLTLLAAGLDTPVLLSTWSVECASLFPDVLDRIRAELAEVVSGTPMEPAHLPRLSYLEGVIYESIRYRMPSPMAGVRCVKKSSTLCGYTLPPGALISMSIAGLGMRADLFPEPEQYRPQRFRERKYSTFEWNPFGFGSRQCVAREFGMSILKVMLASIFDRTQLRLVDTDRRRVRRGLFFVPKHDLRVILERRLP